MYFRSFWRCMCRSKSKDHSFGTKTAAMSIEYTIDIQLTEMGFPDLDHPQEASAPETPPNTSPTMNNNSSKKEEPDQNMQLLKSDHLVEKNKAQSPDTKETNDPPGDAEAEAKNASIPQSKPTDKGGLSREPSSSDDSDVSYIEDDIEDEDDLCEEEEDEEEEDDDDKGNFPCSVCNLQCSTMFKLQDHMNLHTGARPYYCAECGKRFSQILNYRSHLRSHALAKSKQPKCRICLRRFLNEEDLKYHLTMNHFEDKFYECDRCKRVFSNLKSCEQHIELSCMRKVKCENCGHSFPKEKLLKRHLESKVCFSRLKCTECPEVFAKKNELLKHSFSHLGLLPYTCVRCRCHFRLARLYLKHKCKPQSIHCVACLREFLNDHDFQQHKKDTGCWGNQHSTGDEIRCLECGQRFETKDDLKKHAGAHQRVLKCAECGKGFRSALLLMSHMGGHAGQSPCLCQNCGLGFPHQQSYDSHLKTCGQTLQPTKPSKKLKLTKREEQKVTSSKPRLPHSSGPSTVSGTGVTFLTTSTNNTSGTCLISGEPALSKARFAISGVKTPAPEHAIQDKNVSDLCQTRGPSSSSASPNQVAEAKDNNATRPNQEAQDNSHDSAEGCWKLSLDKPPPLGVNLLLFLPVTQNQSGNVALPRVVSVPEMQVQAPPVSNGLGKLQVSGVSGDDCKFDIDPLDLSKKCLSNKVPVDSIKSEAELVDISVPAKISEEKNTTVQADNKSICPSGVNNYKSLDLSLQSSEIPLTENIASKRIKIEPENDP